MHIKCRAYMCMQVLLKTLISVLSCGSVSSQTIDTSRTINFPFTQEKFSMYGYAGIRFDTNKTELPPADLIVKEFRAVKDVFKTDSLYFDESVQAVWFKINILNNSSSDTFLALKFPLAVNKAILYKSEAGKLIYVGKTGFTLAVIARTIPYEDARIDFNLKGHSRSTYYIQVPRVDFKVIHMIHKTPTLESVMNAELQAFHVEKTFNRPGLLWSHFFTGIFCMFFVFGVIKYLVFGKDKAYLYFSLLGFFNALLTIAQSEYPPLELPGFENFRGIELFNLVNAMAISMQGLFILEILQLKLKYPGITIATRWFLVSQLLVAIIYTIDWALSKQLHSNLLTVNKYVQFFILLLMLSWVIYLSTIKKGFYKYIFLGAITVFTAFTLQFIVSFFNLYYMLPAWFGPDKR